MIQKFRNVLVTWGKIQQLWMLLKVTDNEMPSSLNTFLVLLAWFASMSWRTASESRALGYLTITSIEIFATRAIFFSIIWLRYFDQLFFVFQLSGYGIFISCLFFHYLVTVFWSVVFFFNYLVTVFWWVDFFFQLTGNSILISFFFQLFGNGILISCFLFFFFVFFLFCFF